MKFDAIEFAGEVGFIAEREFGAGADSSLLDRLFEEWKAAGSPEDVSGWIRARLQKIFVSVGKKPVWPRDVQDWPEHDGKPMAFLGQLHLPEFVLPEGHKSAASVVYVFGAPDGPPTGWRLTTKTVHLLESLKGAKMTKVIKGVDEV